MRKIVLALGGNALGSTPEEQLRLLEKVAKVIVQLVKDGNQLVLTHGNGPQVGQILSAMEYASKGKVRTPSMPFAECGSMSQGYIGYQLQQAIQDELEREHIRKDCITLITQVLIDPKDPAFLKPTKPIGMFYTEEEARKIEKEKGYTFIEDAGRGYRRVVPSPLPIDIIEKNVIRCLLEKNHLVIAAGGGGIPVKKTDSNLLLEGVEAVIDKDKTASLLAELMDADLLLILTSVDQVYINYNQKNQKALDRMSVEEAGKYIKEGQFAKGSMLPKIEACIKFVKDNEEREAIISSLENAPLAIKGKSGTLIKRR